MTGCVFCCDAGGDFDWCRCCGRGQVERPRVSKQDAGEIEASIRFLNRMSNLIVGHAKTTDGENPR